jgi:hypothetical protein
VAESNESKLSSEDEDESSQLYNLANSILEECTNAAPLSSLDTAVYLFNESLDRRPAPHTFRSDSLKDLAGALLVRFSLTNQRQDLNQAISMCQEVIREMYNTGLDVRVRSQFDPRIFIYHLHRWILLRSSRASLPKA